MDTLLPVHRKEGAKIVEYHPRREWVGYGPIPVIEQDGRFWKLDGRGGGVPLPDGQVPGEVRRLSKERPKTGAESEQLQVAKVCEHCGESFLGQAYDQHLLSVIRELTGGDPISAGGNDPAAAIEDVPAAERALIEGLDEN